MKTLFEECKVKAEKGDADSQYNLGSMYEFGRGTTINYKESIRWYKKAALQGDAVAQFKLGSLNSHDYKESFKWHQLSADQGYSDAQYELGLMYKLGKVVTKDDDNAGIWFKLAADQNHSGALRELRNFDVESDRYDEERSKWYKFSAEQGNAKAQYKLYILSHRLRISDNDALTWLHKSAKNEYLEAQRTLGSILAEDDLALTDSMVDEFGNGYAPTREEELKWIHVAAECGELVAQRYLSGEKQLEDTYKFTLSDAKQGCTASQYELGLMYLYGRGTKQSYKEAAKWWLNYWFKDGGNRDIDEFADYENKVLLKLLQAANDICTKTNSKYLARIQHHLGQTYFFIDTKENNDKGLELINKSVENGCYDAYAWIGNWYEENNNMDEAIKWYKAGAKHGDSSSQLVLGEMYFEGKDVKKDYKEAAKWYLKAAEQGDADAQYNLALMYENGNGVLKDPNTAIEWYGKAIENGNLNAQFNLAHIFYKELNNSKKAIEWWTKAAENGNIAAMFNIGVVNSNRGTFKEAAKWYGKAADKGYVEAQYELGVIHYQEDSVKDYVKSKYWINKAFESSDTGVSKKAENFWNRHKLWQF